MEEKLAGIEARFEEIERELAEVGEDYQRAADLGRERAELEPIVAAYRAYRAIREDLVQARSLLETEEGEMRELAQEEVERLDGEAERLESELKRMLLPSDPRDSRNVIMEIRAGTGGDEASLFAADLFRMYSRFAEQQGWDIEVLSQNETGVGGFKEIIFLAG